MRSGGFCAYENPVRDRVLHAASVRAILVGHVSLMDEKLSRS